MIDQHREAADRAIERAETAINYYESNLRIIGFLIRNCLNEVGEPTFRW